MIIYLSSHILIRSGRTDHNIEINSISLIEAKKDYVKISTTDNSYLVRNNLKAFLDQLSKKILFMQKVIFPLKLIKVI